MISLIYSFGSLDKMYNEINWLPEIICISNYKNENGIDYYKLIDDIYNNFVMDFFNPSFPIMFENKKVVINESILDCSTLKVQNCYNQQYYTCNNCKFKNSYDIFNHICTDDYETLYKNNKSIQVPKLKKRKRNRKIPRTPGCFNLNRACRVGWIKSIIENSIDNQNIKLIKNVYEDKDLNKVILLDVTFILIQEKYKVIIKPIYDNSTGKKKYYVLKTAYYMGK